MDREEKLDALLDRLNKMVNMFGEIIVKVYEANLKTNVDHLEQPMLLPEQEQAQPI